MDKMLCNFGLGTSFEWTKTVVTNQKCNDTSLTSLAAFCLNDLTKLLRHEEAKAQNTLDDAYCVQKLGTSRPPGIHLKHLFDGSEWQGYAQGEPVPKRDELKQRQQGHHDVER